MVLKAGDQGQHGHGVQLWQGAEQRRVALKAGAAALQAKGFVKHADNLCGQVHFGGGDGGMSWFLRLDSIDREKYKGKTLHLIRDEQVPVGAGGWFTSPPRTLHAFHADARIMAEHRRAFSCDLITG